MAVEKSAKMSNALTEVWNIFSESTAGVRRMKRVYIDTRRITPSLLATRFYIFQRLEHLYGDNGLVVCSSRLHILYKFYIYVLDFILFKFT